MSIRRRRRLDPVPHEPSHRRLWQSWWRRCSCGLRAPCVDRLVPAPRLPFPPARNERRAPGGDTRDISTATVADARHHQASWPAGARTGRDVARTFVRRALAYLAYQGAAHRAKVDAPAPGICDSRPQTIGAAASANPGVTTPLVPHPVAQIGGLFDGLLLVDPGLLSPTWWRPEPDLDPGEDTRRMRAGVAL